MLPCRAWLYTGVGKVFGNSFSFSGRGSRAVCPGDGIALMSRACRVAAKGSGFEGIESQSGIGLDAAENGSKTGIVIGN